MKARQTKIILTTLAFILAMTSCLFWLYKTEERLMKLEAIEDLKSVGDMKARQIIEWRRERLFDAIVVSENPLLPAKMSLWFEDKDPGAEKLLISYLDSIQKNHHYSDAALMDASGVTRLASSGHTPLLEQWERNEVIKSLQSKKPLFIDIHTGPEEKDPHIDLVSPILVKEKAIGAIFTTINAREFLYPLIELNPMQSDTSETLLFRKEGNFLLFLNPVQDNKNAALKQRMPLTASRLPAVMAALGKRGFVEGRDYRGEKVFAMLYHIPDSPWFMVSKIDKDEAMNYLQEGSLLIILLGFSIAIGSIAAAGYFLQMESKRNYKTIALAEKNLRENEQRYKEQLETSQERLSAAQKAANLGVWDWNLETGDLYWADENYRIFGLDPLKVKPSFEAFIETVAPEDVEKVKNAVDDTLRDNKPYDIDMTIVRPSDGARIIVNARGRIARDESGKPTRMYGTVQDITERIRATEALRESESRFRSYFETPLIGIAITSVEKGWLEINDKICSILGYSKEELKRLTWPEATYPDDLEPDVRQFNRMLAGEIEQYAMEKRFIRKDGTIVWTNLGVGCVRRADNTVNYVVALIEDISERKQAEAKLRAAKDYAENIIETANTIVVGLDTSGNVNVFNSAAESITGYTKDDLHGKNWFETIVPRNVYPQVWEEFERMMEVGMPKRFENPIRTRSGEERNIIWSNSYVKEGTNVTGTISFGLDVTEIRRAEEELLRVRNIESIGTLAGGIAHDFNNHLGAILGGVDYALFIADDDPDERRTILEKTKNSILDAKRLTSQLLTFAKGGSPILKAASISDLLKETCSFVLSGSKSRVELNIYQNLYNAAMDSGQISQVLQNIIINADQSMPDGGLIKVSARNRTLETSSEGLQPGDYIEVAVEDSGSGISQENLVRIFNPYFTTKPHGTGLGLATSHSIIKKHGGRIDAKSQAGTGTTVSFLLPATKEMVAPDDQILKKQAPMTKARVLMMDDNEAMLISFKRILSKVGYEVTVTKNGAEAVKRYEEAMAGGNRFDIVTLDLTVPGGMGGVQTFKSIKEIDPYAKAIVASGYSGDPAMTDPEAYGFAASVMKPYTYEDLIGAIEKAIGGTARQS